MLTTTAEHALRALLAIARHADGGALRVEEIAALTGAPRNYLGKTLGVLVKAGWLRSARGPQGGFALAMSIDVITIGAVADLFAEQRPMPRCLLGDRPCDALHPCGAHARWTAITAAARAPYDRSTLGDLLAAEHELSLAAAPMREASHAGGAGAY